MASAIIRIPGTVVLVPETSQIGHKDAAGAADAKLLSEAGLWALLAAGWLLLFNDEWCQCKHSMLYNVWHQNVSPSLSVAHVFEIFPK